MGGGFWTGNEEAPTKRKNDVKIRRTAFGPACGIERKKE